MQKWRILFFSLLFYSCGSQLCAQQPVFRNIGINQGLPSSVVYRILQAKNGVVWMSTDAGVCKFNGYSIKCYTTENGLPDNTVFDLIEDKEGRIWMNCFNGTICYFENEKFHIVKASLQLKYRLNQFQSIISSIAFDQSDNLWIGTTLSPFYMLKKDNYAKLYQDSTFNDSAQFVISILDNRKTIESSNRQFKKFSSDFENKNVVRFQHRQNNKFSSLISYFSEYAFNPKICALFHFKNKVMITSRNSLIVDSLGEKTQYEFNKTIISLNADKHDNLWVGLANGGVHLFKEGNLKSKPMIFLENYSISSLLFDSENGLWLSTFEKGVFYAPSYGVLHFPEEEELTTSIAGIQAFGTKVYVATTSNSIFSIDSKLQPKRLPFPKETNLSSIINFYPFGSQLAFGGNKIAIYDTLSKKFKYPHSSFNISYFGTSLSQNNKGNLIFVAQGAYYEINELQVKKKLLLPARSTALYRTSNREILIGTLNGLFTLNETSFIPSKHKVLAGERINCIAEDKHKRIYVATKNKGLFVQEKNTWTSFSKSDGLASNICTFVLCDNFDTIWVATNKGISFFHSANPKRIHNINYSNGLTSNEITCLARKANQLFVGTREGLCVLDLRSNFNYSPTSPIALDRVVESKTGTSVSIGSELDYFQNNITFYIQCPSFKNLFSPGYYYILKGYSDSIHYAEKEILEFQNLSPGAYALELFTQKRNDSNPKQIVAFNFQINPPFWKTRGFILFSVLTASLLVYLLIRWRINLVRKQEKIKTELISSITESRMTALQAQMNPHFIFNAINSIQSLILNKETQNAYDYLAKFARLVRLVLNNSKHNTIPLITEIETMRLYVQMEQLRFKNSFDFEVIHQISVQEITEIELPVMLIQPFIENAIWHGIMPLQDKRKGIIQLKISIQNEMLQIEIVDNGIGRIAANQKKLSGNHKSMGMQLVEERLSLLVSSNKQKASLKIIDLVDEHQQAFGTHISILIPYENY